MPKKRHFFKKGLDSFRGPVFTRGDRTRGRFGHHILVWMKNKKIIRQLPDNINMTDEQNRGVCIYDKDAYISRRVYKRNSFLKQRSS